MSEKNQSEILLEMAQSSIANVVDQQTNAKADLKFSMHEFVDHFAKDIRSSRNNLTPGNIELLANSLWGNPHIADAKEYQNLEAINLIRDIQGCANYGGFFKGDKMQAANADVQLSLVVLSNASANLQVAHDGLQKLGQKNSYTQGTTLEGYHAYMGLVTKSTASIEIAELVIGQAERSLRINEAYFAKKEQQQPEQVAAFKTSLKFAKSAVFNLDQAKRSLHSVADIHIQGGKPPPPSSPDNPPSGRGKNGSSNVVSINTAAQAKQQR